MKIQIRSLPVLALVMVWGFPLLAHHGWSSYETQAQQLKGKVEEVQYANPHVKIKFKPEGENTEIRDVYLAPTSRMTARGLPKGRLERGMTVNIEAYPSKEKGSEMRAERITVDGKTIELR